MSARSGYRGRLAPSPSGEPHLGIARTSLVAYLRARSQGAHSADAAGVLVMRIEDIDTPRVVSGSAEAIMRDLRWLGLDWDEGPDCGGEFGPYEQSARGDHYAAALEHLQRQGLVYPCTCSRKEIASVSSAPHGDLGPRYPGTCRNGPTHPDRPASLRFRMPEPAPDFVDLLHGAQAGGLADDFVLRRSDGLYAYQLVVVVDDIAMRISEVVRGDDLLSSTPRQVALYRALGAPLPSFLHVPLLLQADGRRMSKRFGSLGLAQYREQGVTPQALLGQLAHSLRLTADDAPIALDELVDCFELDKLPRVATQLSGG